VTRIFEISPWVPPAVAARMAGRSLGTIKTWMRTGELPSICIHNGMVLVNWHALPKLTHEKPRRKRVDACETAQIGVKSCLREKSALSA